MRDIAVLLGSVGGQLDAGDVGGGIVDVGAGTEPCRHVGSDIARQYGVHAHARRSHLDSGRLGETDHGMLGCVVGLGPREVADRVEAIAVIFQGLIVRAVHNPDLDRDAFVRTAHLVLRELVTNGATRQSEE
jgi:hypothetical protein